MLKNIFFLVYMGFFVYLKESIYLFIIKNMREIDYLCWNFVYLFDIGVWGMESLLEFCLIFENIVFYGEMSLKVLFCYFYLFMWEELKKLCFLLNFFVDFLKIY